MSTRTTGPAFLENLSGLTSYPQSVVETPRAAFALVADASQRKQLAVISDSPELLDAFHGARGRVERDGQSLPLKLCDLGATNAAALRASLDFLIPRPLGLSLSAGCGDRLGLATPGHVRAIRRSSMRPILAQQSMRENARTGRSPQQVVDDAMWGAFQEGWHDGFGADADHLKGRDDIDRCVAAGYTLYTIDPSEHVDNRANDAAAALLHDALATLPWGELETSWQDTRTRFGRAPDLGTFSFRPTEEQLLRAVVKYARVVAHTVALQRHLQHAMAGRPFELEMSVDESDTVTTLAEHVYIATELKRLGVAWVSLAPRYVGDFEKGVDYRGDLAEFERTFAEHVAVAQALGPYKLSLHSGSDKFSIYPIAARAAGRLLHLKTAGTSYLEALRVVARIDGRLFRDIAALARERYAEDRASYHVSAEIARMPDAETMADAALPGLLEDFHAREILHVTFGSVIQHAPLKARLLGCLGGHEEMYATQLAEHFDRHFEPFR